jgi:hypothetical protein
METKFVEEVMLSPAKRVHPKYKLDGEHIPSVTQILNDIIAKPFLIKWANNLGLNGKTLNDENNNAFAIGTLTHAFIEGELTNTGVDTEGYTAEQIVIAKRCLSSFNKWKKNKNIEVIMLESPFISKIYEYGGTIDAVLKIDGVLTILDWKTSSSISLDYKLQLMAYLILLNENNIYPSKVSIIRLSKEGDGGFEQWESDVKTHTLNFKKLWVAGLEFYYLMRAKK